MKKRLLSIALLLVILPCIFNFSVFAESDVTITVYNWGENIADGTDDCIDVIAEFESAYPHIHVNYVTFDSNESLYALLQNGGTSIDVIIPSDYMIAKLIAEEMIVPLDFSNIPNYSYVADRLKNPEYDPDGMYSVPYTWGAVGIIYNSAEVDLSDEQMKDWSILWDETYSGQILMFDNPRDAFAIAEYQLEYEYPENAEDYNCNNPSAAGLTACAVRLKQQKPLIQNYVMDQIYDKMERGEALIAPYYIGDWVQMAYVNEDLHFFIPSEAPHNYFVDAMCIPSCHSHKKEAELFINFLSAPEISEGNMEYVGYAPPCHDLDTYLNEDLEDVTDRAHNVELMEDADHCYQFLNLPVDLNREMDSLWLEVKTEGGDSSFYLILTLAAIGLLAAAGIVFKVRKTRKKARRCAAWKQI